MSIKTILGLSVMVLLMQGWMLRQAAAQQPSSLIEAIDKVSPIVDLPREGKASVVLMEVSDFECPDCIKHAKETAPALQEMVKEGKISYVFINNPGLLHPHALKFAEEYLCSGQQGKDKYWETIPIIFEKQPVLPEVVSDTAKLNWDEFQKCLDDKARLQLLMNYQRSAARILGVDQSTPTFAIGVETKPGRVTFKTIIHGAHPLATFQEEIEKVAKLTDGKPINPFPPLYPNQ